MKLSPLQWKALQALASSPGGRLLSGTDIHGATAEALIGRGLAQRLGRGFDVRTLEITYRGRRVVAAQTARPDGAS